MMSLTRAACNRILGSIKKYLKEDYANEDPHGIDVQGSLNTSNASILNSFDKTKDDLFHILEDMEGEDDPKRSK